ncbi:hypothetical protein TNCV_4062651 [Trichonephila clavipes]|nr:hypothetical protein TNCV_4062651 [Trichonephila clavipes]
MITTPGRQRELLHNQSITCKLLGFFFGIQVEQFIQSASKLSSPKSISNVRQLRTYRERIDRSTEEVNRRQAKLVISGSLKKFYEKEKIGRTFFLLLRPFGQCFLGGWTQGGLVRRISRGIEVGGGQNIRHPIRHVINPVRSLMELNLQLQ